MKKLVLCLSLAVATAAAAAPGLEHAGEAKSVSVRTADLNLQSTAGVEALYGRLRSAAREVCEGLESRSASTQVAHRECLRTAMDGAVLSAKNDALTKLHLARNGGAASTIAAK